MLTTLRVESRQFPATALAFNLPHLHLALRWELPRLSFVEIFGNRKLWSPMGYRVALFA